MSKKIVFFFPSFASSEATAPLGILAVSTPLLRAGYSVKLIDSTITPNYKKRVLEEVQDALCLGISLVTGPMIRETAEIAKAVKGMESGFPGDPGGLASVAASEANAKTSRPRRITWRISTRIKEAAGDAGRCTSRAWRVRSTVRIARTRQCMDESGTRCHRNSLWKRPWISRGGTGWR